jgi:hypothetical protein
MIWGKKKTMVFLLGSPTSLSFRKKALVERKEEDERRNVVSPSKKGLG